MATWVGLIIGIPIGFPLGWYMRGVMRRSAHKAWKRL